MNNKIPKIITAILILMSSVAFAQTEDNLRSYKFDEFGILQESDWKQRFDRLVEMRNSIPNSKLGIIVYAERGKSLTSIEEIIMLYENYLLQNKKIKQKNINISRGGFRYSQFTELWIVPQNADYPSPKPVEEFEAEIFSEIGYVDETEVEQKAKEFFTQIVQLNAGQGYIFTYGNPEEVSAREIIIRNSLQFRIYDPPRIIFVNGGQNETLKTVFWVVPKGAKPPMLLNENLLVNPPKPFKFDDFGNVSERYYRKTLMDFLKKLIADETLMGVVINYTGTEANQNRSIELTENKLINNPLVTVNNLQNRITFINGGEKEFQNTELWIVPFGAEIPKPKVIKLK